MEKQNPDLLSLLKQPPKQPNMFNNSFRRLRQGRTVITENTANRREEPYNSSSLLPEGVPALTQLRWRVQKD